MQARDRTREGMMWAGLGHPSHLQNLGVGPSAVGEGHVLKVHPALQAVRGQVPIMHHGWLPVNELEHLLGGPHSLHQATIDGAHRLWGEETHVPVAVTPQRWDPHGAGARKGCRESRDTAAVRAGGRSPPAVQQGMTTLTKQGQQGAAGLLSG